MKRLFVLFSLISVFPLMAVDLSNATNQQILNELRSRLDGVVTPVDTAIASYICDSSGYLNISLTGSSAADAKKFYLGSTTDCSTQSKKLAAKKTKIKEISFMAVCDSSGYLVKFSVYPAGKFGPEEKIYIGNVADCLTQAGPINDN